MTSAQQGRPGASASNGAGRPARSELVGNRDGLHHASHTGHCPGQCFLTGAGGRELQGSPQLLLQHSLQVTPRGTHGSPRGLPTLSSGEEGTREHLTPVREALPRRGQVPGHPTLVSDLQQVPGRPGPAPSSGAHKVLNVFHRWAGAEATLPKVTLLRGPKSMRLPSPALPLCPGLFVKPRTQLTAVKQTCSKGCQGGKDPCRSQKEQKSNAWSPSPLTFPFKKHQMEVNRISHFPDRAEQHVDLRDRLDCCV